MTSINLKTVLNDLDAYSSKIECISGGKNTRLYAFTRCLKKISQTPIGLKLFEKLKTAANEIHVRLNDLEKNSAEKDSLTVDFDPFTKNRHIVVKHDIRQIEGVYSPEAILFHEFVHIDRFINVPYAYAGINHYLTSIPALDEEYQRLEEWDVIHGRNPDDFSENAFRKQAGLPIRVTHLGFGQQLPAFISSKENLPETKPTTRLPVTEKNEEQIRDALFFLVIYGLEQELCCFINRYAIRSSDVAFVAYNPGLSIYYDKSKQGFDGIRENMLILLLAHVIKQAPSSRDVPTKVFLKNFFFYDIFSQQDFLKKLCRQLPLEILLERTEILQKAIKEKEYDLIFDLIREKKIGPDVKLWAPKKKAYFTCAEYAAVCNWEKDALQRLKSQF